jgi:hypothetical protein
MFFLSDSGMMISVQLRKMISFGPSEVRATSGQHLGGHYFA